MITKKGTNPNHPKKGTSTKVQPIRSLQAIASIKCRLSYQPRNLCLFTLGINTAYRANELLSLTIGQVEHLQIGDILDIKQSKNSSYRATAINHTVHAALQNWLTHHPKRGDPDAPLFISNHYRHEALTVSAVIQLVKEWCLEASLKGNYGSHTLRKTWGYQQRTVNGTSVALLMKAYGHSTEAQTLEYLGILADEIHQLYFDLEL